MANSKDRPTQGGTTQVADRDASSDVIGGGSFGGHHLCKFSGSSPPRTGDHIFRSPYVRPIPGRQQLFISITSPIVNGWGVVADGTLPH